MRWATLEQTIVIATLAAAALLFMSVLASRVTSRIGVPALLLFLGIGMIAGSEGPGGIAFDNPRTAMFLGSIALGLILFDGGLRTELDSLTPRLVRAGIALSTLGVALTAAVVASFSVLVFDMSPLEGLLLGAVISSTDAAAVFSVLRSRGIGLPERLQRLIEFESGSNDPTAVFLTLSAVSALAYPASTDVRLLPLVFVYRMAGAAALGWLAGVALVRLLNWIDLEYDGLYPVLTLAAVGSLFGAAELAQTSGFMAVYVAGLTMAGRTFVHKRSLTRFHEGLGWLMQVAMFLVLGLQVFPSDLIPQLGPAIGVSAVLILVARPLATFVALIGSGLGLREKAIVSWVGLRGAAPIILATFPMVAGLEIANPIFNIVFVVVIMSVLVQGPSVSFVARRLGIAEAPAARTNAPIELDAPDDLELSLTQLRVAPSSAADGHKLLSVGGPERPLVTLIRRDGWLFIPTGSTKLSAGDELFVLGSPQSVEEMRRLVEEASGG